MFRIDSVVQVAGGLPLDDATLQEDAITSIITDYWSATIADMFTGHVETCPSPIEQSVYVEWIRTQWRMKEDLLQRGDTRKQLALFDLLTTRRVKISSDFTPIYHKGPETARIFARIAQQLCDPAVRYTDKDAMAAVFEDGTKVSLIHDVCFHMTGWDEMARNGSSYATVGQS